VGQIRNATINDHKAKPIFDFGDVSNDAVVLGWGPDYAGDISGLSKEQLRDYQFKCSLLVDMIYFYNLVPLHGKLYTINSETDSSQVFLWFCDGMPSNVLSTLGCINSPPNNTMAVFKDAVGNCHRLSGSDMQKDASFNIDAKSNNSLKINYQHGDANYNFTLSMKCYNGNDNFLNSSITSINGGNIAA
jgi:hypothetical protein